MTSDLIIGFVVGAGLWAAAVVVAALSLWSRLGGSPSPRWWVAKGPIPQLRSRPPFEGTALVILPLLAQTLAVLGAVAVLGPVLAPISGVSLALVLAVAVVQAVLFVSAHLMSWQRWILPLWIYPGWLRETRRQEKAVLPPGRR